MRGASALAAVSSARPWQVVLRSGGGDGEVALVSLLSGPLLLPASSIIKHRGLRACDLDRDAISLSGPLPTFGTRRAAFTARN